MFARVGSVAGDGWAVEGLEVLLDLRNRIVGGEVAIDVIDLPAAGLSLRDTLVRCGSVELKAAEFACIDARFSLELPGTGRRDFPGEAHYDRQSGAVRFELRAVPLAGGELQIAGTASGNSTDLRFEGEQLAIDDLAALAGEYGITLEGWAASGNVDLSGDLEMSAGEISSVMVDAVLHDASVSNAAGTIVTAEASGHLALEGRRADNRWTFAADVSGSAGEAYVEPVYADLAAQPVSLSASGSANEAFTVIDLDAYSLALGAEVAANGELRIVVPAGDGEVTLSGSVSLVEASFDTLYSSLIQVFVAGTLFGDLETSGTISGRVTFEDNAATSADLILGNLIADDRQGRVAVYGLGGEIHWPGPSGEAGDTLPTVLRWQGARAYDIPIGEAAVEILLGGDDIELTGPLAVPTMGGALRINRFAIGNFGSSEASGLLDAELEPIQLGLLTGAFGWPAFSGTLSGRLPLLQYDGEVVTVGGTLTAHAFGGDIEFANLKLEQPFGLVPRLSGDLRLRRLDLAQVTDTFSFGLIQGELSGDVTGLEMVNWRPVAMDLHLYTPPDSRAKRRISQRAVENLASVGGGGGAAAALSSGFMSFFDVFAYKRIGLRCILENGVCHMSGAGSAGDSGFGEGYYIVRGSGLPHIDVVGYRREVDWSQLVRQLAQVTESGGPSIR